MPVDALASDIDDVSAARLVDGPFGLLYKVGRKVLSASSMADLNELALSLVFECANAERGALLLGNPESGDLVPQLQRHRDGRPLDSDELRVPTSIVRAATSQRVGIITSDALTDERFKERTSVRLGSVRSALCVPLWDEGEVLGVIYLDSRIQSYAFTREDLILLNAVANLIAIRLRQEDLNAAVTEQRMMRASLERYHSPDVVEEILVRSLTGASVDFPLEEREVSIMFADLTGFTLLAESMAPPGVADLLNEYYSFATRAVFDQGGSVNDFIGDGVLAVFGAPVAYEDHADRAVLAGIALLESLEEHGVLARVAINTGVVMVGNVGPPSRRKYTVVGDTVNVASRLEGLAEPGFVTLGEETERRLRTRHATEDLGLIKLRGREQPTRAFRVRH